MYKIFAVNLGSTSTKAAYYEDDNCIFSLNIIHSSEEIKKFSSIWDQYQYRYDAILEVMTQHGINPKDLDAVVTRGGHTIPIVGGTYRINEKMLEMSASEKYGNHPTDLGLKIAYSFSLYGSLPMTVDPPTTDEFEPLARYSGVPEILRKSSFHALNHRAVARQYAKDIGRKYEELKLIGVHMGGGITATVHKYGKMVDANNGLLGDGPFSTNRAGTIPSGALIDMCSQVNILRRKSDRNLTGKAECLRIWKKQIF